MQLNTDTSLWTRCADKYAVRDNVREGVYEDYLPRNYGHWEKTEAINFDLLPIEFVLKTNNGCGTVVVIRDKSKLSLKETHSKLNKWLKIPYGWADSQLHYTRISLCIIAEELLYQEEDVVEHKQQSLIDYKVWCFGGYPVCILVVHDCSEKVNYSLDMYDTNWNSLPNSLKQNSYFIRN